MPEGVPANESLVCIRPAPKTVSLSPRVGGKITHVPAQTIRQLARDYANTQTRRVDSGWGPAVGQLRRAHARGSTYWRPLPVMSASKAVAGYGGCANRKFAAGPRCRITGKSQISVMNWVQASRRRQQSDAGYGAEKMPDKLDSEYPYSVLAGRELSGESEPPDSKSQRYAYWRMNQRSSLLSPAICL